LTATWSYELFHISPVGHAQCNTFGNALPCLLIRWLCSARQIRISTESLLWLRRGCGLRAPKLVVQRWI